MGTDIVLNQILYKNKYKIASLLAVGLYIWSQMARGTYVAFIMGMVTILMMEMYAIWMYLDKKLQKQGQKITIDLGNIHK